MNESSQGGLWRLPPTGRSGARHRGGRRPRSVGQGVEHVADGLAAELTERIENVASRHRAGVDVVLAYQPMGPQIPRGTVAAVLGASAHVDGPFCAVNADDWKEF